MNNLSMFAKKAGVATDTAPKTVSCLESVKIVGNKVHLVLDMSKYAEAKSTTSGKEIYLNFTAPKQNVELDGITVGLRIAGNAFIGTAK